MTAENYPSGEPVHPGKSGKAGFLQYMNILLTWHRFIIINVLIITVLAGGISFLLPKWYRATASIMPPKEQGLLNILGSSSSLLRNLGPLSRLGGVGQNNGSYNYFAILKSRRAMEEMVRKFDLMSVYGISDTSMEKAIKELRDNVAFDYQDDDYITIEVLDKDPQRAADMANEFVNLLNTISIELGTHEARNNRIFVEQTLQLTRDSLQMAEEGLKKFQEKSGMLISPEQTTALAAIADLYAARAKKQLEVAILEQRATEDNEELQQLRLELKEYDKSLAAVPQEGLETFRLYRNVMTQEKILEFLVPMYEQAKINEQKDVPVLLLLDKAVKPEKKVRPQRLLIVALAFFLSLFSMMCLSLLFQGVYKRESATGIESFLCRVSRSTAAYYRVRVQ